MEEAQKNSWPKGYSIRGELYVGKVVSDKAPKTVTIERTLVQKVKKYERYKKGKSRISAHNPEEINAREGDIVKIGETKKISKTKSFIVLEIVKRGEQE
jgi:small subunit ribosomal protein S17